MTNKEKQELSLLLGTVIGKQDAMHTDIKKINKHLEKSNDRLANVEHQIMTWKARFVTSLAIIGLAAPFFIATSREFLLGIIGG